MVSVAKRDTSFDSIKFVLIALVVLGHTIHVNTTGFNGKVFSFIYSFHMPAFAIISGYFFKVKGNKEFWKSILELMVVLIFFQLFYFTEDWYNPYNYSLKGALDRVVHFIYPRGATWYIMSLCFWRIFMQYTSPRYFVDYKYIVLAVSIAVALLVGFIPIDLLCSFQRTFFFFPFFLMGYLIHQQDLWGKIRGIKKKISIPIILLYFAIICFVPNFPDSMLTGSFHYFSGLSDWKIMFGLRAFGYLWTLPLTICILSIIPDNVFFQKNGQDTMFYLLYHPLFTWLLKFLFVSNTLTLPTNIIMIIIYWIVIMFVLYCMNKIPLLRFFTKPISTITKKK